jgi:RHS repeat-associated protein
MKGTDWHFYHFDALGSTRILTDGIGNVTDKYAYDAWGKVLTHDRYTNSVEQPYQYVGRLGYYTHCQDCEFALLQLGVRYYDPEKGRFTQRDLMPSAAVSDYSYVDDSPTMATDENGLITDRQWYNNCYAQCHTSVPTGDEGKVLCTICAGGIGTAVGGGWGGFCCATAGVLVGRYLDMKERDNLCRGYCYNALWNRRNGKNRDPLPNPAFQFPQFCAWKMVFINKEPEPYIPPTYPYYPWVP